MMAGSSGSQPFAFIDSRNSLSALALRSRFIRARLPLFGLNGLANTGLGSTSSPSRR
jgi:hypothetical protein